MLLEFLEIGGVEPASDLLPTAAEMNVFEFAIADETAQRLHRDAQILGRQLRSERCGHVAKPSATTPAGLHASGSRNQSSISDRR